jgi:hypothetical protein
LFERSTINNKEDNDNIINLKIKILVLGSADVGRLKCELSTSHHFITPLLLIGMLFCIYLSKKTTFVYESADFTI